MKGKRFTEEQIVAVLKQAEAGVPVKDLCRQHGVSEQSLGATASWSEAQPCVFRLSMTRCTLAALGK